MAHDRGKSQKGSCSTRVTGGRGLNNLRCIKRWNEIAKSERMVICDCGEEADCFTSFTDDNPGRRFRVCCNDGIGGCSLWVWVDPPVCPPLSHLIPIVRDEVIEMRRVLKVNENVLFSYENDVKHYQEEVAKLKKEVAKLKVKK